MTTILEHKVTLQVAGMTCQGCAGKVTRALEGVDGVTNATVDVGAASAVVGLSQEVDVTELIEAVELAGFTATPTHDDTTDPADTIPAVTIPAADGSPISHLKDAQDAIFNVRGMTCANCAQTVEKALRNTPGVLEATVNIAGERARVRYDATRLDTSALFDVVKQAGYSAVAEASTADLDTQEARRALAWLVFSAAVAIAFVPLHHFGFLPPAAQMVAAIAVLATAGATFYRGAYHAARNRTASMDTLVSLGLTAATGYSTAAVLIPDVFHHEHLFFHTAIELVAFIRFGKYLEARVKANANNTLRGLLEGETDRATKIIDGEEHAVLASDLQPGDCIRVRPGERIPADGDIIDGASDIDEAVITGEPVPISRTVGDAVVGGSVSRTGVLTIRVSRTGRDSVLGRIVSLVEDAQTDKAPIQRFADRVAAVFVPAVIVLAVVTFAGHLAVGHGGVAALSAMIAVLVVACPCALGLATPTAIVVGSGLALRRNILIKRASVLEQLASLDTIVFDKTGTLTTGQPSVVAVLPVAAGATKDDVLSLSAPLEAGSLHPLAQAVCRTAEQQSLEVAAASDVQEHAGQGVSGVVNGMRVSVGNIRMLAAVGIDEVAARGAAASLDQPTASLLYVTRDEALYGVIAVRDAIAHSAQDAISSVHAEGAETVMLTGDVAEAAHEVGRALGLTEVRAQLLPADKIAAIREYQASGRTVAMVGDGINDAPALAQADVGIAIGGGTDIAKESGDVVLIGSDVMDVPRAMRLGKATLRKIKQNLGWAMIYNVAALPLAAFGVLPPAWAGLAMALSSVSVVTSSLVLRYTADID